MSILRTIFTKKTRIVRIFYNNGKVKIPLCRGARIGEKSLKDSGKGKIQKVKRQKQNSRKQKRVPDSETLFVYLELFRFYSATTSNSILTTTSLCNLIFAV